MMHVGNSKHQIGHDADRLAKLSLVPSRWRQERYSNFSSVHAFRCVYLQRRAFDQAAALRSICDCDCLHMGLTF